MARLVTFRYTCYETNLGGSLTDFFVWFWLITNVLAVINNSYFDKMDQNTDSVYLKYYDIGCDSIIHGRRVTAKEQNFLVKIPETASLEIEYLLKKAYRTNHCGMSFSLGPNTFYYSSSCYAPKAIFDNSVYAVAQNQKQNICKTALLCWFSYIHFVSKNWIEEVW